MIIENKPYCSKDNKFICVGYSYNELHKLKEETDLGICLDLGHTICTANSLKTDKINYIKKLLSLEPVMYHLTDGDYDSSFDRHDHFGNGNFPIKELLSLIPDESKITIETYKDNKDNIDDYKKDMEFLNDITRTAWGCRIPFSLRDALFPLR